MALSILLCILLAALLIWAARRAVILFRHGGCCCGEHEAAPSRVRPSVGKSGGFPYCAHLKIGGMTCENCARRVENALNSLPDVRASVKISDATAKVLCKNPPDPAALRRAVREAGYVILDIQTDNTAFR